MVIFNGIKYPLTNLIVIYKGGGYDGCYWEWNTCYINKEGEFIDIVSSGNRAIVNIEGLKQRINKVDDNDEFTFIDLSKTTDFTWTDTINVSILRVIADKLDELNIPIKGKCKECKEYFSAVNSDLELVDVDEKWAGGFKYAMTNVLCIECNDIINPTCAYCGEPLEDEDKDTTIEGCSNCSD